EQERLKEADKRRADELEMTRLELSAAETKVYDLVQTRQLELLTYTFKENSDKMDA
ncbi:hypothetical protein RRG08_065677, partial [Elysia crispata]